MPFITNWNFGKENLQIPFPRCVAAEHFKYLMGIALLTENCVASITHTATQTLPGRAYAA